MDFIRKYYHSQIMDSIAPLKTVNRTKSENLFPWFDEHLRVLRQTRDYLYHLKKISGLQVDIDKFKIAKKNYNYFSRKKMVEFYADKNMFFCKKSKSFWKFWQKNVKVKSNLSNENLISSIINDKIEYNDPISSFLQIRGLMSAIH